MARGRKAPPKRPSLLVRLLAFLVTAALAAMSFALILVISLPLGILAARYEGGVLDKILTVLNQITMSIPNFLLGFLLTCVFSLILHWFTVGSFSAAAEQSTAAFWNIPLRG